MSDLGTLETIALLQEEVARLEEELRLRDEALASAPAPSLPAEDDTRLQTAEQRIKDLNGQLSGRDETIDLLWDQVRRLEESQAAMLADWKDVEQWVEQLEQRAAAQLPQAPTTRTGASTAESSGASGDCPLNETTEPGLPGSAVAVPASEDDAELRRRLQRAEADLTVCQVNSAALRERTDQEIEAYRHEIEDLKCRLERFEQAGGSTELSPDERIRALRWHLMDIHVQECEERRSRTILARLTKLFQHTAI